MKVQFNLDTDDPRDLKFVENWAAAIAVAGMQVQKAPAQTPAPMPGPKSAQTPAPMPGPKSVQDPPAQIKDHVAAKTPGDMTFSELTIAITNSPKPRSASSCRYLSNAYVRETKDQKRPAEILTELGLSSFTDMTIGQATDYSNRIMASGPVSQ